MSAARDRLHERTIAHPTGRPDPDAEAEYAPMDTPHIHEGYLPGTVGQLTTLHATYYGERWELGPRFEAEIADGIAEFIGRYDPGMDGLWTVLHQEQIRGGIIIDSRNVGEDGAQLRYFIVDPALHGNGLGRDLLDRAMAFCDASGFERVYLWTVDELEAAVHLYEQYGFEATETIDVHTGWETEVPYRLFEFTP